ncbi:phytanoyl-CoA dioxygenase family protein [Polynucleobacter necessarius]|uniref:phytanoyl-CoA dioxygenase family protein n=1 Tax=Polynucleobacter necessarius TaxID=576610 RepID=UPI000E09D4AE|nr:phytanoyl-CoA dioxygenase family protein [Polynucleobacter necessarius]
MNIINKTQVDEFYEVRFLQLPNYLSEDEVDLLSKQVEALEQSEFPGHVLEEHGKGYRALHGCHLYNKFFNKLIKSPMLLRPAKALLNDDVYVHQLKINLKKPFNGELWPWHQDYIYWREKMVFRTTQF